MVRKLCETLCITLCYSAVIPLFADLKIAEVVDVPHMLVAMHLPKNVFFAE